MSVEDAWKAYQRGAADDWFAAQKLLRAWLRANPEGADALAAGLRAGRYSEAEQAALVLALAKADTPESRRALEGLAADRALPENLRTQAVSALADVPSPTRATVDTLTRLADRVDGATTQDLVGSAATMSLGTLLAGAPAEDVGDLARAYLDRRLADASQPDRTVEALWAVGNAGDAGFLDAVEPLVESPDADLRAAAIHALRRMPSGDAGPLLAARMKAEQHPEVAAEVAQAEREQVANGAALSELDLSLLQSKLIGAPEPLRRELVLTLGAASRAQPEARAMLAAWYPNEPSVAVRVLIGQFVPADELPAAPPPSPSGGGGASR
ncbi:MAG: HEAT repeat domain-containing protein [Myxococcota bacterium]